MSATVFLTILLALGLGVGLGYLLATAILRAMSHRSRPLADTAPLRTVEMGSSGD